MLADDVPASLLGEGVASGGANLEVFAVGRHFEGLESVGGGFDANGCAKRCSDHISCGSGRLATGLDKDAKSKLFFFSCFGKI